MHQRTAIFFCSLLVSVGALLTVFFFLAGPVTPVQADLPGRPAAPGDVYCVTLGGGGPFPGCDQVFTDIQAAIDAAAGSETVKVAMGTYTGINTRPIPAGYPTPPASGVLTQVLFVDKTVTIVGGYTVTNWITPHPLTQPTTLDAQGQGRAVFVASNVSPVLRGLHVTGGDTAGLGGGSYSRDAGGGVYVFRAPAVVSDTWVFSNTSEYGGGVFLYLSESTLVGNRIFSNTVTDYGGGVYNNIGLSTLRENAIMSNTANYGGGIYLNGYYDYPDSPTLEGNTIAGNTASGFGGGVYFRYSEAIFQGNLVRHNTGAYGGGFNLFDSDATLRDNVVVSNTATVYGGGISIRYFSDAFLVNNIIADNRAENPSPGITAYGSGIYINGSWPRLWYTTVARNRGGDGRGIYVAPNALYPANIALTNTILISNVTGIYVSSGHTVTLEATLWGNDLEEDGPGQIITGSHNFWGSPDFVDPANDDFHIGMASAALDRGIYTTIDRDIDGDPRPSFYSFDLGADERSGPHIQLDHRPYPLIHNPGQIVTYTIALTNPGGGSFNNTRFTNTLPLLQEPLAVAATTGTCTLGAGWGGQTTCDLSTVSPGATVHITLTAQVTSNLDLQVPQTMPNLVEVRSDEAGNMAYAATLLQNCHVRLNEGPTGYSVLQDAVDAAGMGDAIEIAGYCAVVSSRQGLDQIGYVSKTLTIQGGWNTSFTQRNVLSYPTTLDARGGGRVLSIIGDVAPTIEGLRIMGGDSAGLGGDWMARDVGGGIYILSATVTLSDSQVLYNLGHLSGGGIYVNRAVLAMSGCTVYRNDGDYGAGLHIYESQATVTGSALASNTGRYGGGIYSLGGSTIVDVRECTIVHNEAAHTGGGGTFIGSGTTTLSRTLVASNTGTLRAGGVYVGGGNLTIERSIIRNNQSLAAGGVYLSGGSHTIVNTAVVDNDAGNDGSGIFVSEASSRLIHTTIARNTGGSGSGIYVDDGTGSPSTVWLTNTILAEQTVGITVTTGPASTAIMDGVLWHNNGTDYGGPGTITVTNAITGDPAFAPDGYHLSLDSAAFDQGVSTYVVTDIDGDLRPYGPGPDLGADEFVPNPQIQVYKGAHTPTVQAGDPLTYTIAITNVGNIDLNATVTDVLPAFVTPSGTLVWTPLQLAPGEGWTEAVVVTVALGYAGPLTNTVVVSTTEGVTGTDTVVSWAEVTPALVVTKQVDQDTVSPGGQLTYTIRITNSGNVALNAVITDTLSEHVMPTGQLVWTATIPTPGGVWEQSIPVTVAQDFVGFLLNAVEVTTAEGVSGYAEAISEVIQYPIYLPLVLRDYP